LDKVRDRMAGGIDPLDAQLLELLYREPRIGVLEASRRLRVARGTVQSRLDKLLARGVVRSFGPEIDPGAIGYGVTAFVTAEISQVRGHDAIAVQLRAIPEVLEAHTITGDGDVLLRVVARSNADLQRVIDRVVATAGIRRTTSAIALQTQIRYRVLPLVQQAAADG
jgi:DNA-binding Lrp family transcriptional regulator